MALTDQERLGRLGRTGSIDRLCQTEGISRQEFDSWWKHTLESRAVTSPGTISVDVSATVSLQRDEHGIPHIYAENDRDLFFGFGWAMAEDRLFQLDWLRRKGLGKLSEILGDEGLERDTLARTVGTNRIAAAEWDELPQDTQQLLTAFSAGVNALIRFRGDVLPVEFDLLGYRPEPWTPIDCLAIECEFRWYLTGRFPVICMPELATRALGEGALLNEYLRPEMDEESILHPGDYEPAGSPPRESVGESVADPDAATGSNNWVISGRRTATGLPLVASDPHIAFEAVSCWYEVHLCGGSFNTAGMAYVGMPAIMVGRNTHVAWGITNNICSQRDLYQERVSGEHPDCFEFDGQWEPARELTETIIVRDSEPIDKTICFSRNGPLVDAILPAPADELGPVSLRWLGMSRGGWLTALLQMDRAASLSAFRSALQPWHVPTFSLVIADVDGQVGYHAAGRIPVRSRNERGFRRGWDPRDQWQGLIPFAEMPSLENPDRGWIASANNRVAGNDFPHRMYGGWVSGARARRIREMIGSRTALTVDDMRQMHQDAVNLRAAAVVPSLVEQLAQVDEGLVQQALSVLREWNFVSETDSVAATVFNVFYSHWCVVVSRARFPDAAVELLAKGVEPMAGRLVAGDPYGWFPAGDRVQQLRQAFSESLDWLSVRFGADLSRWQWGQLHVMPLRHVLSMRGDLGQLLNHGGSGVRGDMLTVCNTGSGPDWTAASGAGYRLIADLSSSPPTVLAIDAQSQSGHPGSPHYSDQYEDWMKGRYHEISLAGKSQTDAALLLVPGSGT